MSPPLYIRNRIFGGKERIVYLYKKDYMLYLSTENKKTLDKIFHFTKIVKEHPEEVYLKISDGFYENFGRLYYYIVLEIENKNPEKRILYTLDDGLIKFYLRNASLIKDIEYFNYINHFISSNFSWITQLIEYTLFKYPTSVQGPRIPSLIKIEETLIKN